MKRTYDIGSKTYREVILKLGPELHKRIVIGTHDDVHGPFPGADNNISAVAGLIELADSWIKLL